MNLLVDSGKGINDLGLYYECINATKPSTYFTLSIILNIGTPVSAQIGLCVPKECVDVNTTTFSNELGMLIAGFLNIDPSLLKVNLTNTVTKNKKYSNFRWYNGVSIGILGLLLVLSIIGTVIDEKSAKGVKKVICWFNIKKNAQTILYSENKVDKNLDILNGVRVLSIGWVVLGHSLVMHLALPLLNAE